MEEEYTNTQKFSEEPIEELAEDQEMLKEMEGDEEVEECVECGGAIREKGVAREVDDEMQRFCSEACANDYEEETI